MNASRWFCLLKLACYGACFVLAFVLTHGGLT